MREAITRLADAGLVEIARNRGFRVLIPNATDMSEIMEVRLMLEVPSSRRAAEEGTTEHHEKIRRAFEEMAQAARTGDESAFWPADRAVHRALLRAAGNRRALDIVDQLRASAALLGPPTTASGRTLNEILSEHRPVVEAVLARDANAAEQAMRTHLTRTGRLLEHRASALLAGASQSSNE